MSNFHENTLGILTPSRIFHKLSADVVDLGLQIRVSAVQDSTTCAQSPFTFCSFWFVLALAVDVALRKVDGPLRLSYSIKIMLYILIMHATFIFLSINYFASSPVN
ncbi:hypothetical protein B0H19DRAFT_1170140 [Mycena capillaripes]|nr:hypothetical protein B0H19DRAFT_1170140 [Mycena capillaripes]